MPFPKNGQAISRPDLGITVREYMDNAPALGFIGLQLMPIFRVNRQAGDFPVIPKEALLALPDTKRAMRGFYNRSDWEFEMGLYSTRENGWEELLDDRERALYKHLFDAEVMCVQRASRIVLRAQEKRIADLVFNATTFTGDGNTLGITNEWDDADAAVPLDDIKTGKIAIREKCGMEPNTLAIAWRTFHDLKRCDQIVDLLKYTFPGIEINQMTTSQLAQVLGVQRVLVGGGAYNSGKKGADATISDIWSDEYAMLTVTADGEDISEPCIGRTFLWTEESGDGEDGTVVEEYRAEGNRSTVYRVRHDTDERLIRSLDASSNVLSDIAVSCSFLFSNVTTHA
jgi:hypothetical protein